MTELKLGANYLVKGIKIMHHRDIRRFAYLPILINTLLFIVAIGFAIQQFSTMMDYFLAWLPDWLMSILSWIIWPLLTSIILLTTAMVFSIIANIIAAPFNDTLAEKVAAHIQGETISDIKWFTIFRQLPRTLLDELRKIKYFLFLMLTLFFLSFIPLINLFVPLLWVLLSAWMLAIQYHDHPMGNDHLLFSQQKALLRAKPLLMMGFGITTLAMTLIPIINFLVIPIAVCGATCLYHEQLKILPQTPTA